MSKISYSAVFHEEGNSCLVEFPDLKGCLSDVSTIEEAFENANKYKTKAVKNTVYS